MQTPRVEHQPTLFSAVIKKCSKREMKIIFHERSNVLLLLLFDDGELYASVVTLLVSNEEKSSTDFLR